jgi:hypothetical protein
MDCVRRGEEPGGLMGRVKARWFVGGILGVLIWVVVKFGWRLMEGYEDRKRKGGGEQINWRGEDDNSVG